MNIGWIAVGVIFLIIAIAWWCEYADHWRGWVFSFLFESTEDTIVTCPTCNIQGVRPLPCNCADAQMIVEHGSLEERLRKKYFD